jgi:aromatic ring-opening dioxygenase LigB subunit
VGFIASAHTAASLTPKAPLALRPEGKELDDLILDCLATDCGSLARVDPELWKEAGACGAGPLTAFGALFEGRRADVLAYDHPFGVGYLVASVSYG